MAWTTPGMSALRISLRQSSMAGTVGRGRWLGRLRVPKASVESKPVVEFPSPATLAAIAARPAPPPSIPKDEARSRDWTVDGAYLVSAYGDRWRPATAWDNAFAAALSRSGRDLRLTQAMSCVARELGRFHLETQRSPAAHLERFIVGACGTILLQVGVYALKAESSQRATDEALLARLGGQLASGLIAHVPATATEAGFWFGRRGKEALAIVAYGAPRADVLPFSLVPDGQGDVTVEGEVHGSAGYFAGYANRGQFGVEPCLVDPSLHRPRFRFICHIDPADATAWIDLLYSPPDRVVGEPFARVLARRTPGQPITYLAAAAVTPEPIASEEQFAPAVLSQLNRIRQQAGLAPVHEAARSGHHPGPRRR